MWQSELKLKINFARDLLDLLRLWLNVVSIVYLRGAISNLMVV